jgi:hypothetical protein
MEFAWEQLLSRHAITPITLTTLTDLNLIPMLESLAISSSCPHQASATMQALQTPTLGAPSGADVQDSLGHGRQEILPASNEERDPGATSLRHAWKPIVMVLF